MTFSAALELLKAGLSTAREAWTTERYIYLQYPDDESTMTEPYLVAVTDTGLEPWIPTQTDLLSDDWQLIDLADEESE